MYATLEIPTTAREQLADVTANVQEAIRKSGFKDGVITLYVPHTTCGITINENADPNVARDIIYGLSKLIPQKWDFRHVEGNSDAHLKSALVGFSCQVPVSGGSLMLGTWQAIYLAEFDGPRRRKLIVCS